MICRCVDLNVDVDVDFEVDKSDVDWVLSMLMLIKWSLKTRQGARESDQVFDKYIVDDLDIDVDLDVDIKKVMLMMTKCWCWWLKTRRQSDQVFDDDVNVDDVDG